jgi:DNA-binding phage protein
VPTLRLKSGSTGTRSKPAAAKRTPARKAAAKQAPTRKTTSARKPAASATQASTNGAATRGPKLPDGWTKSDFTRIVKDMQKARAAKEAAAERLAEAQEAVNGMALDLIAEGIQMSVVSKELDLSRQWLYKIMEDNGVKTERQQGKKPARSRSAGRTASKPAAKPAARKAPAAKKPAAKKAPARKSPARKSPAATGRARVRITR